jgi:segregation and condensation protein B
MSNQAKELKQIVEAAILVADDPISINRIISIFPDGAKPLRQDILSAIEELSADCSKRGIELNKVGSGYRYQSKKRYAEFLRKLYELKPPRYSRAALETLSIIAYKQPVTRGDIEDVRGVSVSTDIMRALLNRHWVKEVGFKDVPGRPALYATTKEFLAYFNLKTIREMPELQQKRELEEIARDNQITLPLDELVSDEESSAAIDAETLDGENRQADTGELVSNKTISTAGTDGDDVHIDADPDLGEKTISSG